MKKQLYFLAAIMLLASNCQQVTLPENSNSKEIKFQVTKQEKVSMRAALTDACKRLSYYRYTNDIPATATHQTSDQDGYGIITDELTLGEHELYFVGYNSEDACNMEEENVTFSKIGDTFSYYTTITVNEETAETQSISMPRRVAKFELVATDALPSNLSVMEMVITGASTVLDAKTGKGGTKTVQTKTINVPASNLGKTDCTFSAYVFLSGDETGITISSTAKDASGNIIISHTFDNVKMQTNYITRYKGTFFVKSHESNIRVDSEWNDIIEKEY